PFLAGTTNPVFFFQAEDGIRDLYVTGVQTCALPIWLCSISQWPLTNRRCKPDGRTARMIDRRALLATALGASLTSWAGQASAERSEERRVGKECRRRGATER